MAFSTEYVSSEATTVQEQTMKQTELIQKIQDCCVSSGLSYAGMPPDQISPGVWLFYAVKCSDRGACRQTPRYAVEKGDRVILA